MFVKLHITDKTEECLAATTWNTGEKDSFYVCGEGVGGGVMVNI